MIKIHMFLFLFSIAFFNYSYGSGQIPCSSFVSPDGRSFFLDRAYSAADLVVIGQVSYEAKTILRIKMKIKGDENFKEIELMSNRCQGTACSGGFSVAPKIDLLFLLKRQSNGIYDSVTGNGNNSCPVVYEVEKEFVKFGDKKILITTLEKYLKSKPAPVSFY